MDWQRSKESPSKLPGILSCNVQVVHSLYMQVLHRLCKILVFLQKLVTYNQWMLAHLSIGSSGFKHSLYLEVAGGSVVLVTTNWQPKIHWSSIERSRHPPGVGLGPVSPSWASVISVWLGLITLYWLSALPRVCRILYLALWKQKLQTIVSDTKKNWVEKKCVCETNAKWLDVLSI